MRLMHCMIKDMKRRAIVGNCSSSDIHSTLNWPIVKSEKLKIEYFRFDI